MEASRIAQLAWLARIALSEQEIKRYSRDMEQILAMVDIITRQDIKLPPLAHPLAIPARLRQDIVSETGQRGQLQQGAPALAKHHYIVPQVLPEK